MAPTAFSLGRKWLALAVGLLAAVAATATQGGAARRLATTAFPLGRKWLALAVGPVVAVAATAFTHHRRGCHHGRIGHLVRSR